MNLAMSASDSASYQFENPIFREIE